MIENLIKTIPSIKSNLFRGTDLYDLIEQQTLKDAKSYFGKEEINKINFEGIGEVTLPYFPMGNINTTHLFGLDELILFSYYFTCKNKYSRVADIGANVGLHSVVLAKIGYIVSAYEPDPEHCAELLKNTKLNGVEESVTLFGNAVDDKVGEVSFTRVKGNTTGNHISGTRKPYGDIDIFNVKTVPFRDLLVANDLVKVDVEGHEAILITSTEPQDWDTTDAFFEVGSVENAKQIFKHLQCINVRIFSQKIGWNQARSIEDLPISHKEGSIFITKNDEMLW